jgi:hypothetical protein
VTQSSGRSHVQVLEIAMDGFPELWAALSPIGKRVFLRDLELAVRAIEETIEHVALRDSVLRGLADPNI